MVESPSDNSRPQDAGKTIGAYHPASVSLELCMAWASLGQGLTRLHQVHWAGASLVDAVKTWEGTSGHQTFLLLSLVPKLGIAFLLEHGSKGEWVRQIHWPI